MCSYIDGSYDHICSTLYIPHHIYFKHVCFHSYTVCCQKHMLNVNIYVLHMFSAIYCFSLIISISDSEAASFIDRLFPLFIARFTVQFLQWAHT